MGDTTFVIKHTVPVYVTVKDGVITSVVVEDDKLSKPEAVIEVDNPDDGWDAITEEKPLQQRHLDAYRAAMANTGAWPAWDFGF